jgi:hypothetical protein
MTTEKLDNVMSPETGMQIITGGPSPFMGGAPGTGRPPAGRGGPPPMAPPSPDSTNTAKRLDTLENKNVYLVDIGFGGGYNFMTQLQKWFAKNMPSVTTVVRRKPGNVFMDDKNDLWEEVKEKGNAVVVGVAG